MIRCFFAVRLPPAVISQIAAQMSGLRRHDADVAWVPERNLHVTLRFLGEIAEAQVGEVLALARSGRFDSFNVRVRGFGAYPGLRNARTFWCGIEPVDTADSERLLALQTATETWSRRAGGVPENRRYSPHLTLGRVRRPGPSLRALIDDITTRELVSDVAHIEEFVLMRSTLSDQAAVYEPIERFALGGS